MRILKIIVEVIIAILVVRIIRIIYHNNSDSNGNSRNRSSANASRYNNVGYDGKKIHGIFRKAPSFSRRCLCYLHSAYTLLKRLSLAP